MIMRLYLVRHAQSQFNAEQRHQHPTVPLLPHGVKQAKQLAKRMKREGEDFSLIIASPYLRTRQTAQILKQALHLPVHYSDLLVEVKVPSIMIGRKTTEPKIRRLNEIIMKGMDKLHWRHLDGESFAEIRERGNSFLRLMRRTPSKNILVVSHARMIRVLLGLIQFGGQMSPKEYKRTWHTLITNTGMTICEYQKTSGWKLITLNDHSHLFKK